MINRKVNANYILPFDFCEDCILRIETMHIQTRYFNTCIPEDVVFTCEHADACNHAVMATREGDTE